VQRVAGGEGEQLDQGRSLPVPPENRADRAFPDHHPEAAEKPDAHDLGFDATRTRTVPSLRRESLVRDLLVPFFREAGDVCPSFPVT
jgi:hypothetical protein